MKRGYLYPHQCWAVCVCAMYKKARIDIYDIARILMSSRKRHALELGNKQEQQDTNPTHEHVDTSGSHLK